MNIEQVMLLGILPIIDARRDRRSSADAPVSIPVVGIIQRPVYFYVPVPMQPQYYYPPPPVPASNPILSQPYYSKK